MTAGDFQKELVERFPDFGVRVKAHIAEHGPGQMIYSLVDEWRIYFLSAAIAMSEKQREPFLRSSFDLVEQALETGDSNLSDSVAIEVVEALYSDQYKTHRAQFTRFFGNRTKAEWDAITAWIDER